MRNPQSALAADGMRVGRVKTVPCPTSNKREFHSLVDAARSAETQTHRSASVAVFSCARIIAHLAHPMDRSQLASTRSWITC